ncbi:hypothetical protein, conserved [Eimeria necatrix]|uniref:Uncharacterized protein n=1 Tax=Eimeria necatrix TaxID=51315 RepID=U6MRJ6_9EIME|nr:hypothetical protein, conserved [Eimeria necatrix]CDJ64285.1 hypothetical protein, conserved [Eimeria necatrix]
MGGAASAAAPEAPQPEEKWLLENVLFFDPKNGPGGVGVDLRDRSDSSDDSIKSYEPEVAPKRQNRAQRRAQALQARTGCPLHGNEPCRCAVERPAVDFLKRNKYETDSSSDEESEINASHSLRYPIAIDGPCEAARSEL